MALFVVSVVALSIPVQFQMNVFKDAWSGLSTSQKTQVQDQLGCCGFDAESENLVGGPDCLAGHPMCNTTKLQNVGYYYNTTPASPSVLLRTCKTPYF